MKYFLHGLLLGSLTVLPLAVLAEHIRYGFVSNHVALWVVIFAVCALSFMQSKGMHVPLIVRGGLFTLYAVTLVVLCVRIVSDHGPLLAVLVFTSLYACYSVFDVARKGKVGQN